MEHRHINTKNNQWNVAIVHSIWERGLEKDICALIREVKSNATAADAVRKAIPHSKVYGWPKFFRLYLEKIHVYPQKDTFKRNSSMVKWLGLLLDWPFWYQKHHFKPEKGYYF